MNRSSTTAADAASASPVLAGTTPANPVIASTSITSNTPGAVALRPEALRYHRLGRLTPSWWRPLATLVLACIGYLALWLLTLLSTILIGVSHPEVERTIDAGMATETADMSQPVSMGILLIFLALAVPACRWAVRVMGRRGTLDSVTGRFRWDLFVRTIAPVLAVMMVVTAVALVFDPTPVQPLDHAWWLALLLLIVPFQAAGEEYVFRGLLPQVLGTWLRSPVWGVLVSLPLFVVGHTYNALGLLGVGVFAAGAAYLVWRTGGLEVVIAWHAVNNVLAFGYELLGLSDPNAPITPGGALLDIASTVAIVGLVEWLWRTRWSHNHTAVAQSPAEH